MKSFKKFRKGAASFYIVAFSTLILLIVATSFATIIISEINRTSNNDLSQSAYDSAMAGVEDAKLAYYNYLNCVNKDSNEDRCEKVKSQVRGGQNCNMVNTILGREGGELIETNTGGNNMQQAYTCVIFSTILENYENTMSSSKSFQVIDANFVEGDQANKVSKLQIDWYSARNSQNGREVNYGNFIPTGKVLFGGLGTLTGIPKPPTISVAILQTGLSFNLADFDATVGKTTNKGMVYLVPMQEKNDKSVEGNHKTAWNGKENYIDENGFLDSNNQLATNVPYTVYCNDGGEYLCSVTIDLPRPVEGENRNPNTFKVIVALPYGAPEFDYRVTFKCNDGTCGNPVESEGEESSGDVAYLDGVQIEVDSTGRANDLYRRIITRLENGSSSNLSIMGPLELLGDESGSNYLLEKNYSVTSEYNF